jgi:hypothetical protein
MRALFTRRFAPAALAVCVLAALGAGLAWYALSGADENPGPPPRG